MSEVAVKKTIKKPVVKKSESVQVVEQVAVEPPVVTAVVAKAKVAKAPKATKEVVATPVVAEAPVESKAKKSKATKAPKAVVAEVAESVVVPVAPENTVSEAPVDHKGSKTTSKNIDAILRVLVTHFNLDEKVVKNVLADYLPLTSTFKKRRKAKKDPEAPKKAPSSFMKYNEKKREEVIRENPGIGFKEIAKKVGESWRNLTPEQKQVYENEASVARREYEEKDAAYRVQKGLPAKVVKQKVVKPAVEAPVAEASS